MSIANIQILLVAGYDSVSSVLTLLLWELARNEDVQSRLYTDVSESLRQHDGRFDYDALADMPYLDAVINGNLFHKLCYTHPSFRVFRRSSWPGPVNPT